MADYNVTCPDFRFCEVKHKYMSPCDIWDCNACWWHYANCTVTPEAPSQQCPYVKCHDLTRPQSHTIVTLASVAAVVSVLAIAGRYMYRRYRRRQEVMADPEGQEEHEEEEEDEEENENERVPLLQRCRSFLSSLRRGRDRFREVIFGARAVQAPPEVPQLDPEPR